MALSFKTFNSSALASSQSSGAPFKTFNASALATSQAGAMPLPKTRGPISALSNNPYNTNTYKYPNDLGNNAQPSYVIFDIYAPMTAAVSSTQGNQTYQAMTNSRSNLDMQKFQKNLNLAQPLVQAPTNPNSVLPFSLNTPGVVSSVVTALDAGVRSMFTTWMANRAVGQNGSTVSPLGAGALSALEGLATAAGTNELATALINLNPPLVRTDTSIMIYMPDTIKVDYEHDYGPVSGTEAFGQVGLNSVMGKTLTDAAKNIHMNGPLHGLQSLATSAYGREILSNLAQEMGWLGQGASSLALKSGGYAINPQTELLYKGTSNRTFELTFLFYPRSQLEAQAVQNIITAFKLNAAPSINNADANSGRYFIVPNQFDIRFMFKTAENQYISKVSTSVLKSIQVNYAGAGEWITMEDGAPAAIMLQLWFMESEIMYRELIASGGY